MGGKRVGGLSPPNQLLRCRKRLWKSFKVSVVILRANTKWGIFIQGNLSDGESAAFELRPAPWPPNLLRGTNPGAPSFQMWPRAQASPPQLPV